MLQVLQEKLDGCSLPLACPVIACQQDIARRFRRVHDCRARAM